VSSAETTHGGMRADVPPAGMRAIAGRSKGYAAGGESGPEKNAKKNP
jgi:hypothetical protein